MGLRQFKGNFGLLQLFEDGSLSVHGLYGNHGTFQGTKTDDQYQCIWKNGDEEGKLIFQIHNGQLTGQWSGTASAGPVISKWSGTEVRMPENWTILHDLGTMYVFFGNLAERAAQEAEMKFVNQEIRKWDLFVDGRSFHYSKLTSESAECFFDVIYDHLYVCEDGTPSKSPFEFLNLVHANIVDYFNEGVLEGSNIRTLLFSLFQLCEIDGVTSEQIHQLAWFVEQWKPTCPEVEGVEALIKLTGLQHDLGSLVRNEEWPPLDQSTFQNPRKSAQRSAGELPTPMIESRIFHPMNDPFYTYCEQMHKEWLDGELDLHGVHSDLFDLDYAPEPYMVVSQGSKPLYMLLTNPGAPMAFQHRTQVPRSYRAFSEVSSTIYQSDEFAKEGGANARRRLRKSLDFSLLLDCNGLVNVETIPFHSATLNKKKALTASKESQFLQSYQAKLRTFLSDKPTLIVAACRSDKSISKDTAMNSPWIRFQCELASIDLTTVSMRTLSQKGDKVTSALFTSGNKHLVLTMGSNNLPSLNEI